MEKTKLSNDITPKFIRLFRRAISFVGKDYLSYSLWDKYIAFELSQQQWDSLALIYIQTLRFPTKKLSYYHSRCVALSLILLGSLT